MPDTTLSPPAQDAPPGRRRGTSWRRALVPALVVVLGLFVVAPVAGSLSGKLSSVTENDQAAFLPDSAESTRSTWAARWTTGRRPVST